MSSAPALRYGQWLMRRRWAGTLLLVALTGALGAFALRVRPDYSIELLFPVWDPARQVYDRFKADFPHEDTRAAVIIQADDAWTPAGLERIRRLEQDLAALPGVEEVIGPTRARALTARGGRPALETVLPAAEGQWRPEQIAEARKIFTSSPLFAGTVAAPDGSGSAIVLRLDPAAAGSDEGRQAFLQRARALFDRHQPPGQRLVLSGVPALRARFAEMILRDSGRLVPLALLMVLALLWVAFRSAAAVVASLATVLVALLWTYGTLGLLGYPVSMAVSILPVIVIIISISDSVHLVNEYLAQRRAGLPAKEAVAAALGHTAVPSLLTEVVLACGFLSLLAVNITALLHFGVASAIAMLLAWLANVLVLPLALSVLPLRPGPERGWALEGLDRVVAWIGDQVSRRPRLIAACAVLALAGAVLLGRRVSTESYVFDDLRPGSALAEEIAAADRALGGTVPLAIYVETLSGGDDAALDPQVVLLADRAAAMLRAQPEIGQAVSLGDFLRQAAGALGLTETETRVLLSRSALVRALSEPEYRRFAQDVLSPRGRTLAIQARAHDVGSGKTEAMFARIEEWIAREQAAMDARPDGPRVRISATGQHRIFKDVNDSLMTGLVGSFGTSLLISFAAMCLVLRSWKLGLIGLVPNVAPIVLVLGFMPLAGIALKPLTVVVFSISLVIAEDDTIQLLARLRRHYLQAEAAGGAGDPHVPAALGCLREVARPILVTSTCVSLGFLLLLASEFLGPAHLGLLVGATLLAAVLADLFVTPILIIKLRPFARRRQGALHAGRQP